MNFLEFLKIIWSLFGNGSEIQRRKMHNQGYKRVCQTCCKGRKMDIFSCKIWTSQTRPQIDGNRSNEAKTYFFINFKLKRIKTQNLSRTQRTFNINPETQILFQTIFCKIKDIRTCKIIVQVRFEAESSQQTTNHLNYLIL